MMFRFLVVAFAVAAQAIPMPDGATQLAQAINQEGEDDGYGLFSIVKKKRGAMDDINKAKASVLEKIKSEKDICLTHVEKAKVAALAYVTTGASMDEAMTAALAIVTAPATKDNLDQQKEASAIELWDIMEAKRESLRLVKQMKHGALEAYYKIRSEAVSAIHKAMSYSVHYIMKVAKGGVSEESVTMDDMVSLIGFDLDSAIDVAVSELMQPSPVPSLADEEWSVRSSKKAAIADMKAQKDHGLSVITNAKNDALAKIKTAFAADVHEVRQALKGASSK